MSLIIENPNDIDLSRKEKTKEDMELLTDSLTSMMDICRKYELAGVVSIDLGTTTIVAYPGNTSNDPEVTAGILYNASIRNPKSGFGTALLNTAAYILAGNLEMYEKFLADVIRKRDAIRKLRKKKEEEKKKAN